MIKQEEWGRTYASRNTAATTLQQIGWTAIGGQYTGMYGASAGSFDLTTGATLSNRPCYFSSSIASDVGIIYTTNGASSGTNGTAAFTSIDPSLYPGLFFSVDSQASQGGGQFSTYLAAEVGGA